VDGLTALPEYSKKHPHSFPVPVDSEGDVQELYRVFRFPESFIIGRDGKVVEHIIGGRDWSDKQMVEHFKQLLAK
jgi:peroxiredoxin